MTESDLKQLIQLLEKLGWCAALPTPDADDEEVSGLIIGTREYVDSVTASLEKTGWEQ